MLLPLSDKQQRAIWDNTSRPEMCNVQQNKCTAFRSAVFEVCNAI